LTDAPKSRPSSDIHNFLNESTARTLEDVFRGRFAIDPAKIHLLVVPTSALGDFADPTKLPGDAFLIAYTVGDLTDQGAHPPVGFDLPTGRLGYVVVARGGEVIGGGLLIEDLSASLIQAAGAEPTRLDQVK